MRPNPDIPPDTNIIMFKIAPRYVKNGTLDGYVGFQKDKDYAKELATGERGSYFKPLEAYALKSLIAREQHQLKAYYDQFDAKAVGQGGDISVSKNGFYDDFSLSLGPAYSLEMLWGSRTFTKAMKSKRDATSFGIHVKLPGEGFLNKRMAAPPEGFPEPGQYPVAYDPDACPGKVNQYRFMSFYLAPRKKNSTISTRSSIRTGSTGQARRTLAPTTRTRSRSSSPSHIPTSCGACYIA